MRAIASVALLTLCAPAGAQQAGDTYLQTGWLHVNSLDKSKPLQTHLTPSTGLDLLGVATDFSSPGTFASLNNINTVAIATTHYFTAHWALKADGGIPAIFHIDGGGIVQPTSSKPLVQNSGLLPSINLGLPANNPLAKARQWTPAMIVQYTALSPDARLRPYAGLGIAYNWFSDISVNDHFQADLNNNFGRLLALGAGKPGPTHVDASASRHWAPVYNAGFTYTIDRHWGIVSSVSSVPLHAKAHIRILAEDGTPLADSVAAVKLDPLVTALLMSYRF